MNYNNTFLFSVLKKLTGFTKKKKKIKRGKLMMPRYGGLNPEAVDLFMRKERILPLYVDKRPFTKKRLKKKFRKIKSKIKRLKLKFNYGNTFIKSNFNLKQYL